MARATCKEVLEMDRFGVLSGSVTFVAGLGGVVVSAIHRTAPTAGLTLAFCAFIALFGLLALLVRNPTPDH